MFYGMPIHIIRDVALTIRSFYKRITDFVRYRQATRDMNARYPDATPEEVAREDVCIICREDMRPWSQRAPPRDQPAENQANTGAAASPIDERSRPKKLPCGHILHFACLRSWLERQQNCPTCRRPVLDSNTVTRGEAANPTNQQARAQHQAQRIAAPAQVPAQVGQAGQNVAQAQNVYQFGPLRIAFGARQGRQEPQQNNGVPAPNQNNVVSAIGTIPRNGTALARQGLQNRTIASFSPGTLSSQLQQIEQQLMREIHGLRLQHEQLYLVRALQAELTRLRLSQTPLGAVDPGSVPGSSANATHIPITQTGSLAFTSDQQQRSMSTDHQDLPTGLILPEGWTLLPLRRLADLPVADPEGTPSSSSGPTVRVAHTSTATPWNPRNASEATDVHAGSSVIEPLNMGSSTAHHSDIGSTQLPPDAADNDSGHPSTNHLSHARVESPVAAPSQSASNLPHWGSGPAAMQDESTPESGGERTPEPGSDVNRSGSQPSGERPAEGRKDKGKGKAASIEDAAEDAS